MKFINECNHGWIPDGGKCLVCENEQIKKELEKYKAAIGYFQREGTQVEKDIVKNLLSY